MRAVRRENTRFHRVCNDAYERFLERTRPGYGGGFAPARSEGLEARIKAPLIALAQILLHTLDVSSQGTFRRHRYRPCESAYFLAGQPLSADCPGCQPFAASRLLVSRPSSAAGEGLTNIMEKHTFVPRARYLRLLRHIRR